MIAPGIDATISSISNAARSRIRARTIESTIASHSRQ